MTKSQNVEGRKEYIRKRRAGCLSAGFWSKMGWPGEMTAERSMWTPTIHGGGGRREAIASWSKLLRSADLQMHWIRWSKTTRPAGGTPWSGGQLVTSWRNNDPAKHWRHEFERGADELGYSYDWVRHVAADMKMKGWNEWEKAEVTEKC